MLIQLQFWVVLKLVAQVGLHRERIGTAIEAVKACWIVLRRLG